MSKFGIAIHGGAGTISRSHMTVEKEEAYRNLLEKALDEGYDVLHNGGTALDAVEAAVIQLENAPLFNAGKGSVFNSLGEHEMDASIMDGKDLQAGSIAAVKFIKNPIKLARKVLSHSDHVLLAGSGAQDFARQHDITFESAEYFYTEQRHQQWLKIKDSSSFQLDHTEEDPKYLGTVGAVALDHAGNLAAATSTGGMTNKKFGRIGDSPLIGLGNYANNNTCAVSCTGSGEYIMRGVTAYDISCLMEYKSMSLDEAATFAIIEKLTRLGGDGGVIAIDAQGNFSLPFNCEGMYRGYRNEDEKFVGIYK